MPNLSFSKSIADFGEKTKVKADIVLRKVALDMLRGVVVKSPVDTGRFRASWRVSVNTVDLTYVAEGGAVSVGLRAKEGTKKRAHQDAIASKQGNKAIAEGTAAAQKAKIGDAINITNNLPYADRLENSGWSDQAPQGMMKLTFQAVVDDFDNIVWRVKSGETE